MLYLSSTHEYEQYKNKMHLQMYEKSSIVVTLRATVLYVAFYAPSLAFFPMHLRQLPAAIELP